MPARGRRGGGFPIWLGIILLVILGVVLWLFLKGDAFNTGSTGTTAGGQTTGQAGGGSTGQETAQITVGGDDLLALAGDGNASLVDREGDEVTATGVTVQSVVADGVMWVGTDADHRVLVVTTSGTSVGAGDRVSFHGTLQPLPIDFADRYDISSSDDATLLTAQGHYVQAGDVSVT